MEIRDIDEHREIDPLSEIGQSMDHAQLDFINYTSHPDPNFNYERNQKIIDGTIAKNKKKYEMVRRARLDALGERADMVVDFVRHLDRKSKVLDGSNAFSETEKYFGKELMKKLYGEKLIERLKIAKRQNEQLGKVLI